MYTVVSLNECLSGGKWLLYSTAQCPWPLRSDSFVPWRPYVKQLCKSWCTERAPITNKPAPIYYLLFLIDEKTEKTGGGKYKGNMFDRFFTKTHRTKTKLFQTIIYTFCILLWAKFNQYLVMHIYTKHKNTLKQYLTVTVNFCSFYNNYHLFSKWPTTHNWQICLSPHKNFEERNSLIELSLNYIHWIYCILTKSKSSMVTRDSPYITTGVLLHTVVKKKFPSLSLVWYLFNVLSGNRHQTRGSRRSALYTATIGKTIVARWVLPLVTRPIFDCIMIHWIQWKPFRGNSNTLIKNDYTLKNWCVLSLCPVHSSRLKRKVDKLVNYVKHCQFYIIYENIERQIQHIPVNEAR